LVDVLPWSRHNICYKYLHSAPGIRADGAEFAECAWR
jgi:hypothetical protein